MGISDEESDLEILTDILADEHRINTSHQAEELSTTYADHKRNHQRNTDPLVPIKASLPSSLFSEQYSATSSMESRSSQSQSARSSQRDFEKILAPKMEDSRSTIRDMGQKFSSEIGLTVIAVLVIVIAGKIFSENTFLLPVLASIGAATFFVVPISGDSDYGVRKFFGYLAMGTAVVADVMFIFVSDWKLHFWWYPTALMTFTFLPFGLTFCKNCFDRLETLNNSVRFWWYPTALRNCFGRLETLNNPIHFWWFLLFPLCTMCNILVTWSFFAYSIHLPVATLYTLLPTPPSNKEIGVAVLCSLLLSLSWWTLYSIKSKSASLAILYMIIGALLVFAYITGFLTVFAIPLVGVAFLHYRTCHFVAEAEKKEMHSPNLPQSYCFLLGLTLFLFCIQALRDFTDSMQYSLLVLAIVVYIVGFLERKVHFTTLALIPVMPFLFFNTIKSGIHNPGLLISVVVICVFCGLLIRHLPLNLLLSASEPRGISYVLPLYGMALAAAVATGFYTGDLRLTTFSLFVYAIIAFLVLCVERRGMWWSLLVSCFVIWAMITAIQVAPWLPLIMGIVTLVMGVITKKYIAPALLSSETSESRSNLYMYSNKGI